MKGKLKNLKLRYLKSIKKGEDCKYFSHTALQVKPQAKPSKAIGNTTRNVRGILTRFIMSKALDMSIYLVLLTLTTQRTLITAWNELQCESGKMLILTLSTQLPPGNITAQYLCESMPCSSTLTLTSRPALQARAWGTWWESSLGCSWVPQGWGRVSTATSCGHSWVLVSVLSLTWLGSK